MDEGQSDGVDGSDSVSEHHDGDEVVEPEPDPGRRTPLNPRQVRARRRRHRRQLGTLLFLVVAAAILATAYFTLTGGSDDSSDDAASSSTTVAAVTTTAPFSGAYNVSTGVNIRQGAGTSFPTVGTVEAGKPVTVVCVAQGESVDSANGPNAQWLRVTAPAAGYVSAAFVGVGGDLTNQKIPACPAA